MSTKDRTTVVINIEKEFNFNVTLKLCDKHFDVKNESCKSTLHT